MHFSSKYFQWPRQEDIMYKERRQVIMSPAADKLLARYGLIVMECEGPLGEYLQTASRVI